MSKVKSRTLVLCVLLTAICASLYFIIFLQKKVFPKLQADSTYAGKIEIEDKLVDFIIANGNSSKPLLIFSDASWWGEMVGEIYQVNTPHGYYIMHGIEQKPGFFAGPVGKAGVGDAGRWQMVILDDEKTLESIDEVQSLNQLLNLNYTLQEIESQIEAENSTISQQKLEIERISQYLTEGQSLRANADKKFNEKKSELDELKVVKNSKQKEAEQLREKFDISQRLFGTGKLVYLSRNTLDLEKRWFNSMFTSAGADTDADFENLVARAERIMLLKNEIAYELNRFGADQ